MVSKKYMRHPLINALVAGLYIVLITTVLQYIGKTIGPEDPFLMPIAMLFLLVLSASLMGYLFLWGPAELYLEGKKAQATRLFLSTVFIFAVLTALVLCALLYTGVRGVL